MRLRPRYSLLTLLVLTALIAGGVKLWYGPHRVVMSEPLTAEEESLLELVDPQGWQRIYAPVVYEYEYHNDWNGRQYLIVKGTPRGKRPLAVRHYEDKEFGFIPLHNNSPGPEILAAEQDVAKYEQVVCWISPANHSQPKCYFLTNRKELYQFHSIPDFAIEMQRVELSAIDDPVFRACVARALASIPNLD